jgi:hypothetical protein
MHRTGVGRTTERDQKAQKQNGTHRILPMKPDPWVR